jgi:hypothetical protein
MFTTFEFSGKGSYDSSKIAVFLGTANSISFIKLSYYIIFKVLMQV